MAKLTKFDAAKYLDQPETIAAYLTEALATDDPEFICLALDTIAKAKGMTKVAKDTGLSRESLYKSLSGTTKPEFDTVRKSKCPLKQNRLSGVHGYCCLDSSGFRTVKL